MTPSVPEVQPRLDDISQRSQVTPSMCELHALRPCRRATGIRQRDEIILAWCLGLQTLPARASDFRIVLQALKDSPIKGSRQLALRRVCIRVHDNRDIRVRRAKQLQQGGILLVRDNRVDL